jgi:hypothetical protein
MQDKRECGACTLCCKLVAVAELQKPLDRWCTHCEPGHGCSIYETRPQACRSFSCEWLLNPEMPDFWRPAKCGMVIALSQANLKPPAALRTIHCNRAGAWREPPFL